MSRPTLTVLDGGAEPNPRWLDLPATLVAKSPHDPTDACVYRVSRRDIIKAARQGRRQPVFDFWSIIAGQPPPVNNVRAVLPLIRLDQAHACFRGANRPLAEDDTAADCVAYVLKPRNFYRFDIKQAMSCVAWPCEVPSDLVFMVYARLDVPCAEPAAGGIIGVLNHWKFVETDPDDASLPVDWQTRFTTRLW